MRSFSKMLPDVKFMEDKVLVFVVVRDNATTGQLIGRCPFSLPKVAMH